MSDTSTPKKWVKVSLSPSNSAVTVTLLDGNLTAKASAKCFREPKSIRDAVPEAERQAQMALEIMREFQ